MLGLVWCLSWVGCRADGLRDFMAGSYVNDAGGVYSVASDTLLVKLVKGNDYRVDRRTGYNLIREGKLGQREFGAEVWWCRYREDTGELLELKWGKLLVFYPSDGVLRVGSRVYRKVDK